MSAHSIDVTGLPDPDDTSLAWWHGEPAMLAWWRRITDATTDFAEIEQFRLKYRIAARYAHAVPNLAALNTLAGLAPLVEIGAGAGYWARLLRDMGCDIVAFDNVTVDENVVTADHAWTEVDIGDVDTLRQYPDQTVFVCWPERPHGFMPDLLDHAPQTTLALITDGPIPPSKGGDPMYERLDRDWTLTREVAIPVWPYCVGDHDRLAIWTRR